MDFVRIRTEEKSELHRVRKGYSVDRVLPDDKAIVYFNPRTNLYARGTLKNYYGEDSFNWRPLEKMPEWVRKRIPLIAVLEEDQRVPDYVGRWKVSRHYKQFHVYFLYNCNWKVGELEHEG